MTWEQWLQWACLKLNQFPNPRREAEILLGTVINKSRTQLLAFGETTLDQNKISTLQSLINRRKIGEPITYLIGSKEFWSLKLKVSPGTFIPRPDTESLIAQVLNTMSVFDAITVLDLGSGVGTIALALASEKPKWRIIGIDQQQQALILANQNKVSLTLKNVKFKYGNWFKYLKKKKFYLIVSNPPYIKEHDPCLLTNGIFFEPKNALVSKKSGLADLTIICKDSIDHLYPNGWLFLEHGWKQGQQMRKLFHKFGFINIHTICDYHHYERVTYGQWNPFIPYIYSKIHK